MHAFNVVICSYLFSNKKNIVIAGFVFFHFLRLISYKIVSNVFRDEYHNSK